LIFFTGILATWWGHQVVSARTSSSLSQAEVVARPIPMSATDSLSTQTSVTTPPPAANTPRPEVNRSVIRRGDVVPDEEIEVRKPSVASASGEGL
jgi:hypothetical protein